MSAWKIRVPASTSNLGPGFDQLGLCLSLGLVVQVRSVEGHAPRRDVPADWPAADEDRLLEALRIGLGADRLPDGLELRARSEIPIGRGLGSSGAAVAAGLRLGRALAGEPNADPHSLLAAGIEAEGHPDNVTASLLGGLTLCLPTGDDRPPVVRPEVHPDLRFVVCWPDQPLPTPEARAALPRQVAFADAVENARRLPVLLEGLRSGDGALLALGIEDRLHVPYRLPLLPGAGQALAAARAAGAYGATISGAGSALIAICPPVACEAVGDALAGEVRAATGHATARTLEVVHSVPTVERA